MCSAKAASVALVPVAAAVRGGSHDAQRAPAFGDILIFSNMKHMHT